MTPAKKYSGNVERALIALFKGKKAKWIPLFHRLAARLTRIPGISMRPVRASIALHLDGQPLPLLAVIRILPEGFLMSVALPRAALRSPRLRPLKRKRGLLTHEILIQDAAELDDEILLWLKAAQHLARTATP